MYTNSTIGVPSIKYTALGKDFFDSMFDDFNQIMKSSRFSFEDSFPPINLSIHTDDGGYELCASLAGYKKDWLHVSVEGTVLTIDAEVENENEDEDKNKSYLKKRIKLNSFTKSYKIPEGYDAEKAEVTYTDGLLSIYIPIKEKKTNTLELTIK